MSEVPRDGELTERPIYGFAEIDISALEEVPPDQFEDSVVNGQQIRAVRLAVDFAPLLQATTIFNDDSYVEPDHDPDEECETEDTAHEGLPWDAQDASDRPRKRFRAEDFSESSGSSSTGSMLATTDTTTFNPPSGLLMSRSHRNRAKKRKADIEKNGHAVRPEVLETLFADARPFMTAVNAAADLPVSSSGYGGAPSVRKKKGGKRRPGIKVVYELPKAIKLGLKLICWDGRTPYPILDVNGKIIAILVGRPSDPRFVASCQRAFEAILAAGKSTTFSKEERDHRRGKFPALNVGVTHGKGTSEPVNLDNGTHTSMLQGLLDNKDIQQLASFASSAFKIWAPNVFKDYQDHLDPLFKERPHLKRIFPGCIFPCAAFNFGPRVCCYRHRDCYNVAHGLCAIYALGRFNPDCGGHIHFWNLGVTIRYPPCSLVLLSSATIEHNNSPVQLDEERVSLTFFCAAGLFRYVDNGFRTEQELKEQDRAKFDKMGIAKAGRWEKGFGMISKFADLLKQYSRSVKT